MGDISPVHDYVLAYAKDRVNVSLGFTQTEEELSGKYSNPDDDPRGPWTTMDLSANHEGPYFGITNPDTGEEYFPAEGRYWVFNESEVLKRVEDGRIIFGKSGTARPVQKVFLRERSLNLKQVDSWWDEVALNADATEEQRLLFGKSKLFINPKPVKLIKKILSTVGDGTVLDFFSGSGTTAQAVMELNAEDQGSQKWICVQLREAIDEDKAAYQAGYRAIDEMARFRIEAAAAKIKEETGADIDYGFKLFRLEEPSEQTINQLYDFDPEDTALFAGDYVAKFATEEASGKDVILITWLNQDGFGLNAQPRQVNLAGYALDVYEDSAYIIEAGITSDDVIELVRLVETGELDISRVVVFGYSVPFNVMHELKKNMNVLKSGRSVKVIERL